MKSSFLALPGLAILAAAGFGGWVAYGRWREAHTPIRSIDAHLTMTTAAVQCDDRRNVLRLFVKPGDAVAPGQVLATLDDSALLLAVKQDEQKISDAQKTEQATQAAILPPPILGPLPSIGPPPTSGPIVTRNAAAQAFTAASVSRRAHVQAQLRQLKLLSGPAADKLKADETDLDAATHDEQTAEAPVAGLQTSLEMAQTQRDKYQSLYNDGIISRLEFQNKLTDLDAAQAAVDAAQKQMEAAKSKVQDRQGKVSQDQSTVDKLNRQISSAEEMIAKLPAPEIRPQIAEAPAPLPLPRIRRTLATLAQQGLLPVKVAFSMVRHEQAQNRLDQIRNRLNDEQARLATSSIRAASPGIVVTVPATTGRPLPPNGIVATTGDPTTMRLTAHFAHADALHLKPGQPCLVGLPQAPMGRVPGTIQGFTSAGGPGQLAEVIIRVQPTAAALAAYLAGAPIQVTVLRP